MFSERHPGAAVSLPEPVCPVTPLSLFYCSVFRVRFILVLNHKHWREEFLPAHKQHARPKWVSKLHFN